MGMAPSPFRPTLTDPSLPYQNAIWHGFVVAAAACHYLAIVREIAA